MKGRLILNFVGFEVCWALAVATAAWGLWYLGSLAIVAFLAAHLYLHPARRREAVFLAGAAAVGLVVDSLQIALGVFRPEAALWGFVAPLWLVMMWPNLAATVGGCLAWMRGRPALAAVLGALGGPAAYLGAAKLGAVTMGPATSFNIAALAIAWGIAMPVLFLISDYIHRPAETPPATNPHATPV